MSWGGNLRVLGRKRLWYSDKLNSIPCPLFVGQLQFTSQPRSPVAMSRSTSNFHRGGRTGGEYWTESHLRSDTRWWCVYQEKSFQNVSVSLRFSVVIWLCLCGVNFSISHRSWKLVLWCFLDEKFREIYLPLLTSSNKICCRTSCCERPLYFSPGTLRAKPVTTFCFFLVRLEMNRILKWFYIVKYVYGIHSS